MENEEFTIKDYQELTKLLDKLYNATDLDNMGLLIAIQNFNKELNR